MTRLWKFLGENGKPYHGGTGAWPLPTLNDDGTWTPGEWLRVEGMLVPCLHGIHLCRDADLIYWPAPRLYEAEAGEEQIDHKSSDGSTKLVVREARLLRPAEHWNERTMRLWACDCAERVLPIYEKHQPNDARPRESIAVARRFANGDATRDGLETARAAAWEAAREAAGAAAWAAAREAAWAAAREAAREAAWAAAWEAAWAAAWEAAREAEREWQLQRLLQYLNGEVD